MSKAQEILNKTIGNPMQGFLPLVKKLITSRQNCRSVSAFHFSHQNHCSGHSGHVRGFLGRDSWNAKIIHSASCGPAARIDSSAESIVRPALLRRSTSRLHHRTISGVDQGPGRVMLDPAASKWPPLVTKPAPLQFEREMGHFWTASEYGVQMCSTPKNPKYYYSKSCHPVRSCFPRSCTELWHETQLMRRGLLTRAILAFFQQFSNISWCFICWILLSIRKLLTFLAGVGNILGQHCVSLGSDQG